MANLEGVLPIKNPLQTHGNMEAQTWDIFKRNVCWRPTLAPQRTLLALQELAGLEAHIFMGSQWILLY